MSEFLPATASKDTTDTQDTTLTFIFWRACLS